MKATRFSEAQIVAIIQQQQTGATVAQIIRGHGIGEATTIIGTGAPERQKYGGMQVSEVKQLKDLEDENRRLKKMNRTGEPAELSLEHEVVKEALRKK